MVTLLLFYSSTANSEMQKPNHPFLKTDFNDHLPSIEHYCGASDMDQSEQENRLPVYNARVVNDLVEVENNVYFDFMEASSILNDNANRYGPENLGDNNSDTAWAEGDEGDGTGEHLNFATMCGDFPCAQLVIKTIYVRNGYTKSQELFQKNNRAQLIEINSQTLDCLVILKDTPLWQAVDLPEPILSDWLTITIRSVYPGTHYNDLCISELLFSRSGAEALYECTQNCDQTYVMDPEGWEECIQSCLE